MATDQEDIAADGDVYLVVGEDKKRLRVSSTILSAASPVFQALLGPRFREGQQARSAANPVDMALPDDGSRPLSWLCGLLHHRRVAELEANGDTKQLLAFAVAVDKYDCSTALYLQSRALLMRFTRHEPTKGVADAASLHIIAAAYLLREAGAFRQVTGNLIALSAGHLGDVRLLSSSVPMLPADILSVIEEKREVARVIFVERVMSAAQCPWDVKTYDYGGFIHKLVGELRAPYWPPFAGAPRGSTLKKAIHVLQNFGDFPRTCGRCGDGGGDARKIISGVALKQWGDWLAGMIEGLCLQCVLEDKANLMTKCTEHV